MSERATGHGRSAMMGEERWIDSGPEVGEGSCGRGVCLFQERAVRAPLCST